MGVICDPRAKHGIVPQKTVYFDISVFYFVILYAEVLGGFNVSLDLVIFRICDVQVLIISVNVAGIFNYP